MLNIHKQILPSSTLTHLFFTSYSTRLLRIQLYIIDVHQHYIVITNFELKVYLQRKSYTHTNERHQRTSPVTDANLTKLPCDIGISVK